MTPSEETLVRSKPEWWRKAKFAPMKASGRITQEQYEYILSLPYSQAIETPGEVRTSDGYSGIYNTGIAESDSTRTQVDEPISQESFIAALERDDKSVLPERANGSGLGETGTHSDIIPGDSQNARVWRLLQDGDWHDANEIQRKVYGAQNGLCAIPSRVSNINAKLREKGKGKIESRAKEGSLWEWRYVEKDGFAETVRNISSG